jgi:hypothetical protein
MINHPHHVSSASGYMTDEVVAQATHDATQAALRALEPILDSPSPARDPWTESLRGEGVLPYMVEMQPVSPAAVDMRMRLPVLQPTDMGMRLPVLQPTDMGMRLPVMQPTDLPFAHSDPSASQLPSAPQLLYACAEDVPAGTSAIRIGTEPRATSQGQLESSVHIGANWLGSRFGEASTGEGARLRIPAVSFWSPGSGATRSDADWSASFSPPEIGTYDAVMGPNSLEADLGDIQLDPLIDHVMSSSQGFGLEYPGE